MKTLLFATGETKKLTPLTNHVVSPMLPILNRPVMDYALEVLGKQNIKHIDISLHNRPDEIEAFFGDGTHRGLQLTYHLQREAWGDGGAVRWAFSAPNEAVLLLPADILIDLDLDAFMAFHETHRGDITVLVTPTRLGGARQPRLNVFNGRVTCVEKGTDPEENRPGYVSTGIYLISPEVIGQIPHRKKTDILTDLIPSLIAKGCSVIACEFSGFWNGLETFMQYQKAQLALCACSQPTEEDATQPDLKYLSRQGRQVSKGIWIGRNSAIHGSAKISPIVYMHDNNRIEKDVQIGPDVIIGRNVVVDSEATLENAIILDHTYVGRMLNVQSKIIYKNLVIDILTGEHIIIKDEFLLAETEEEHVDFEIQRFISSVIALVIFLLLFPFFFLVGLFLWIAGSPILSHQECTHTDFRWFVPVTERRMRKFNLFQFQLHRKDGTLVPFGKLLEVSQFFRYPELINVVNGDIAFIGVSPLPTEVASQLSEEWQKTRFSVPAGLTGLWYLRTDEKATLDQILVVDSFYAATRNIKTDLSILFQLPQVWIKRIFGK